MCSLPEPGPALQCLLMKAKGRTVGRNRGCGGSGAAAGFLQHGQLAAPQTAGGLQRLQLACHTLQKPHARCAQCGMLQCSFLQMRRGWRMLYAAVAVRPHLQACCERALPPHEDFAKMRLVLCARANITSVGLMPSSKKLFEFTRSQHLALIVPKRVRYTASLSLWVFLLRKHSAPGNGDSFFSIFLLCLPSFQQVA